MKSAKLFNEKRGLKKRQKTQPHDLNLKYKVIDEYLSGDVTYQYLSSKYQVARTAIIAWVQKYQASILTNSKPSGDILNKYKRIQSEKPKSIDERIRELEKALEDERIKNEALNLTIEIAEKEYKLPIRKKFNTK